MYVACPSSFQTGGTEALHALALELRNLGLNAFMFYKDVKLNQDVVGERFKCFNIPYVLEIEDSIENVLVVPEIYSFLLNSCEYIQKVFWWLSVDNYFLTENKDNRINFNDKSILHLAQSWYAWDFLKSKKVTRRAFLADYLRDDFFEVSPDYTSKSRRDIVLYNPQKGLKTTQSIIEAAPELEFVALENMTPQQIRDICLRSKIYIDFGQHPGKDRFPREAGVLGNIVITGDRGSAAFDEDVPILPQYKIRQDVMDVAEVVTLLKDCQKNYDKRINDFKYFREFIKIDKAKFIFDLKRIFRL